MKTDSSALASTRTLVGQCLCGGVRYEVADKFGYALICHCSNCRRTTGSANKPFAGIKLQHLTISSGQQNLLQYGDERACDIHCNLCGSLLYSIVRDGEYAHVALGSLTNEPSIRPSAHIFVASKAPWEEIDDGLPQFDEHA